MLEEFKRDLIGKNRLLMLMQLEAIY